jgi:glycosyl transferase family 25
VVRDAIAPLPIRNIILNLPATFVINMERDQNRREAMRARLDAINLPFEFFSAVDGRTLSINDCAHYDGAKRRRFFGRDMTPGEVGCLLSHRGIYERMIRDNLKHALILEDDVMFEADFPDVLRALLKSPIKWNMIRFLGCEKIYNLGQRKIVPLTENYWLARIPGTHGGAHAYLLTLDTARILMAHSARSWLPIDTLHGRCWETGLESLVVHPAPLMPDEAAGSTIEDARFDKTRHLEGLDALLYPLRRFRFKLGEGISKRWIYFSSWFRDKRARTNTGAEQP